MLALGIAFALLAACGLLYLGIVCLVRAYLSGATDATDEDACDDDALGGGAR